MYNQFIIVGRLTSKPKLDDNKCMITVAVPREYKNKEGIYETDFIQCIAYQPIANNLIEYCDKGDLIGISGKIQSNSLGQDLIVSKITLMNGNREV